MSLEIGYEDAKQRYSITCRKCKHSYPGDDAHVNEGCDRFGNRHGSVMGDCPHCKTWNKREGVTFLMVETER